MLNQSKQKLAIGTVAVLAVLGVVGIVAKKKIATQLTDSPADTSSAINTSLGMPETPGTPHLAQPGSDSNDSEPGAEPSEGSESTVAVNRDRGHENSKGGLTSAKDASGSRVSVAMLTPAERKSILKAHPEFARQAELGNQAELGKQGESAVSGESKSHVSAANGKPSSPKGGQASSKDGALAFPQGATLNLALLTPAERESIVKAHPELTKQKQDRTETATETTNAQQKTVQLQGPIMTKPGEPLVLLQPGMPGHPATPVTAGTQVAEAKPEPAVDSCYTVTFHHKHPGMRTGDETCSHHKNLLRVHPAEGLKLNPKTVCIRVNGTPVKFSQAKGKPNDFIIGIVVGIETAVTARYCTGRFHCNEDCKVPKDEFVEAIGGSDMDTDESQKLAIAVWDKEDPNDKEQNAKLAGDMHKGLKDLDEVAKAAAEGYTLFQDWIPDNQSIACQAHQALGGPVEDEDTAAQKSGHRKVASKR
jgi:hypothetical protein